MADAFAIGRQARALETAVSMMTDAIENGRWDQFVRAVDTIQRQSNKLHRIVTEFNQYPPPRDHDHRDS